MADVDRPNPEVPWFGLFSTIPDAFAAEAVANLGYDYVCFDLQHGLHDEASLRHALMAMNGSNTRALVRPVVNEVGQIGRALDLGATGVIVPMVETAQQAAAAVAACRYAPDGVRSLGPMRATFRGPLDPPRTNRETLCIVMIETLDGLANLDEICATPGLDGVYVGPADLATSLGIPLAEMRTSQRHREAVAEVCAAGRAANLIVGLHCFDGASARGASEAGFTMVTVATDVLLMRGAAAAELRVARTPKTNG